MMSERQKQYRDEYQAQIHPYYSGLLHVGVMYSVGLSVIAFCLWRMQGAAWEWLLVVPVFVVSNLFEWWIHKYVMHRLVDVWALRAIYDRHTRQHHQYFTDGEMTVDSTREFRIIFFPWRALFTFIGMGVPAALALAWLVNANAGYVPPQPGPDDGLQHEPDFSRRRLADGYQRPEARAAGAHLQRL